MSLSDFTTLPSLDDVQMAADFIFDFDLENIEQPTFGLDDIDRLFDPEQLRVVPQVVPSEEFVIDPEFFADLTELTEVCTSAQPEIAPHVIPSDEFNFDADLLADLTDLTETEMQTQPAPSLWHDSYGFPITGPSSGMPSPRIPFVPATPLPLQQTQNLQWPSSAGGPKWWKPTLPPPLPPRRAPFHPSRVLYLAESTLGITGPNPAKCNPEFMWYGSGQTSFPPPGKPMRPKRGRKAQEDYDELDAQVPTNAYELRRALIPMLATTPDEAALRAILAPQMYAPHPLSLYPSSIREPATTLTIIIRRRAKWLAEADTEFGASAAGPPPLLRDVAPGHTYRLPALESPAGSPLTPLPDGLLFRTPTTANISFATSITDATRSTTPSPAAAEEEQELPSILSATPSPPPPTRRRRKTNLPLPRPDSKRLAARQHTQEKRDALRAKWPGRSLAQAMKAEADTEAKAREAKKARGGKVQSGRVAKSKTGTRKARQVRLFTSSAR